MQSDCPERLAISRKISRAVDTLCDPALDLESVLSLLVQTRAGLFETERALHDHIQTHGCG